MSIHLHTRSSYTLLSSTLKIDEMVKESKRLGFKAVACTDLNVMHGAMEFYHCCLKENIKPIFGLETALQIDGQNIMMLILAKNDEGFKSLMKASSLLCSNQKALSLNQYLIWKKDWITILYGEGGIFEEACIHENHDEILSLLKQFKEQLGDFKLALSYQETSFWKLRNQMLKQLAKQVDIATVALNKIYYLKKEDAEVYRALCGIKEGKTFKDKTLLTVNGRYMLSALEMEKLYEKEDLDETEKIAQQCNVSFHFNKTSLPQFICPDGLSSAQYLTQLALAGLKKRFQDKKVKEEYIQRLKYELDIIVSMHFEDYFLIVWDFIRYSRQNKIFVGPGRGSAAGSLVSYCLGITHLDPICYGLLFERFLNPERVSMPDIDTDFPDNRRDEVIDYVINRYGKDHIAHICTFGTLACKQSLRDIGRVLDVPLRKVDALCKAVPNYPKITLQQALKDSRFHQILYSDPQYLEIMKLALKVEGLPRHVSMHAAGIVMSKRVLDDVVPVIQLDENCLATQYTMEYMEELGLIKMDFLGLRNLTIIDEIVKQIQLKHPEFDIMKIPLDDAKTFQCLQAVDTVGIFQLESDGMRNLIKKIKPTCFDDIVAAIALFRPGPMENIPLYLKYRKNPDEIQYLHPNLIPVLQSTYGVMIYQEQIMQTAQIMAGFSLSKADILRKAMSKKKENELLALKNDFIDGCLKNGHSEALANQLYEMILRFANYGFNKSHSVAYGLLAYQLAYLKANAPLEFFQALLNSVIGSESKTSEYIDECRRRNAMILPPSINASSSYYRIEKNGLRFPLRAIKGIGEAVCKDILEERKKGLFTDYYDFITRILGHKVSRKCIEYLICAGALDEFKVSRKSMLASLDEAISYADLVRIEIDGQFKIDLGLVSCPIMITVKDDVFERAEKEKEVLGFYLSSHPILTLKENKNIHTENLAVIKRKQGIIEGFALITRVKQHKTKKGDTMAFISVVDESTDFTLISMPDTYKKYNSLFEKGNYVLFRGKKDEEETCILQNCVKIDM